VKWKNKKPRRELDFYPTPSWATKVLLHYHPLDNDLVLEPCSGSGDITSVLSNYTANIVTNDICNSRNADHHLDMTVKSSWDQFENGFDWIITNPPFSEAPKIIPLAFEYGRRMAMLLRLSYLEPCNNRADWLIENPPCHLIVLPRISFTGDGKTDSVTAAWFVWEYSNKDKQKLTLVPKSFKI